MSQLRERVGSNGIILLKHWLDVSEKEQYRDSRLASRTCPSAGSSAPWTWNRTAASTTIRARDAMLGATDVPFAPWYIVPSDYKKRARLNCISDIVSRVPDEEVAYAPPKLPGQAEAKRLSRTQVAAPGYSSAVGIESPRCDDVDACQK